MIRYTVVWHRRAQHLLTEIWLQSADRHKIAVAANQIDRELATDASEKGIAAKGRIRKMIVPPLNCLYEVVEADRFVNVVLVRRTPASRAAGSTSDRENGGPHN